MRPVCVALTASLLVVSTACTASAPPPAVSPTPPAESAPAQVRPGVDAAERELIDLVLRDLLSSDAGETPVSGKGKPPARLLVSSRSARWGLSLAEVLYRDDAAAWSDFPAAADAALRQAAEQVIARAQVGFEGFKSADQRVTMVEPTAGPPEQRRSADRPIHVWPPGYSADGELAVVCLEIPWSMHSSHGTYVLRKTGSSWTVVVRQFVYFC